MRPGRVVARTVQARCNAVRIRINIAGLAGLGDGAVLYTRQEDRGGGTAGCWGACPQTDGTGGREIKSSDLDVVGYWGATGGLDGWESKE